MGWKLAVIIIKDPGQVTDGQVLDALYDASFKQTATAEFTDCMDPEGNTMYFGSYNGCLIFTSAAGGLVEKFFTKKVSKAEQIFMDLFPGSEIGAFTLMSTVNYYAWTVLSRGRKIRTKQGDGDNGITCDFGTPLPEEEEFLKLSYKDEEGILQYEYTSKSGRINIYTEDQLGENYVSKIWSRFTGKELIEDEELLNNVAFRVYERDEPEEDEEEPKSFWKRLFTR